MRITAKLFLAAALASTTMTTKGYASGTLPTIGDGPIGGAGTLLPAPVILIKAGSDPLVDYELLMSRISEGDIRATREGIDFIRTKASEGQITWVDFRNILTEALAPIISPENQEQRDIITLLVENGANWREAALKCERMLGEGDLSRLFEISPKQDIFSFSIKEPSFAEFKKCLDHYSASFDVDDASIIFEQALRDIMHWGRRWRSSSLPDNIEAERQVLAFPHIIREIVGHPSFPRIKDEYVRGAGSMPLETPFVTSGSIIGLDTLPPKYSIALQTIVSLLRGDEVIFPPYNPTDILKVEPVQWEKERAGEMIATRAGDDFSEERCSRALLEYVSKGNYSFIPQYIAFLLSRTSKGSVTNILNNVLGKTICLNTEIVELLVEQGGNWRESIRKSVENLETFGPGHNYLEESASKPFTATQALKKCILLSAYGLFPIYLKRHADSFNASDACSVLSEIKRLIGEWPTNYNSESLSENIQVEREVLEFPHMVAGVVGRLGSKVIRRALASSGANVESELSRLRETVQKMNPKGQNSKYYLALQAIIKLLKGDAATLPPYDPAAILEVEQVKWEKKRGIVLLKPSAAGGSGKAVAAPAAAPVRSQAPARKRPDGAASSGGGASSSGGAASSAPKAGPSLLAATIASIPATTVENSPAPGAVPPPLMKSTTPPRHIEYDSEFVSSTIDEYCRTSGRTFPFLSSNTNINDAFTVAEEKARRAGHRSFSKEQFIADLIVREKIEGALNPDHSLSALRSRAPSNFRGAVAAAGGASSGSDAPAISRTRSTLRAPSRLKGDAAASAAAGASALTFDAPRDVLSDYFKQMDDKAIFEEDPIHVNFISFLETMRNPALRSTLGLRKLEGHDNIWEYRLNNEYRVYVSKNGDGSWELLKGFEHMPVKK